GVGRCAVHAEEAADPSEVVVDVLGGDGGDGKVERAADRLCDLPGGYAFFCDGVQPCAGGCLVEAEGDQAGCVVAVYGGPSVGSITGAAGDALVAGDRGEDGDEPVVAGAVHGRRKAQADGVYAVVDELDNMAPTDVGLLLHNDLGEVAAIIIEINT